MNSARHDSEGWLSLVATAEILGSTPLNVMMHIKRGLLAGVEQDGGWLVDTASLARLLEQRQAGMVAAVCASGCARKAGACGNCA